MKQIIKKPLISEKSFSASSNGKFSFIGNFKTDKIEAKDYIENVFKVKVEKINSLSIKGKVKRVKGKLGTRNNVKKFIVTLKKGQKISLFEAEKEEKPEKKKLTTVDNKEKTKKIEKTKEDKLNK